MRPVQLAAVATLAVMLVSATAEAQIFVYPRRPHKSVVRYFDFDWWTIDIAVGELADTRAAEAFGEQLGGHTPETVETGGKAEDARGQGGVRLYFYERERVVAERAAAFIEETYNRLIEQFRFLPRTTFPYILYSSYAEFLQTNLFPVQEGVLGVTSPIDLKLALPYFGDHQMFQHVSAHEMAHQFTIHKVRALSEDAGVGGGALEAMPLWFIEGLAEFYSWPELDPEAKMFARDLLVNADAEKGYALIGFFEDRPGSGAWTYRMGHVRCAFLERVYGEGTIQRLLEATPLLVGDYDGRPEVEGFATLVEHVTGDTRQEVAARFEEWLKRRAYGSYLDTEQSSADLDPALPAAERVDSLNASPDGTLVLFRNMDMVTYRSRLNIVDPRDPSSVTTIAADGVPGVESLHPVSGRNFDINGHALVFVAQANGSDLLYWQPVTHHATRRENPPQRPPRGHASPWQNQGWTAEIELGERRGYELRERGVLAAEAPALSPDGTRVAFVGLLEIGQRDIFLLTPGADDDDFSLTRLTNDVYAERQVAWGPDGIVYTSDATEHGRYNLFHVEPEEPHEVERLTTEDRDHQDPEILPDGRLMFVAWEDGRANLHELVNHRIIRRTDLFTGVFDPSPGPDGDLWALHFNSGELQPVLISDEDMLNADGGLVAEPGPAREVPSLALVGASEYNPFALKNWNLGPAFGILGVGAGGVYGQLIGIATDRMNNHALLLDLSVFGAIELTHGHLLYINQESRISWGAGPFQELRFRVDRTFAEADLDTDFVSAERFFGGTGTARYPFNEFMFVESELAIGGMKPFLTDASSEFLGAPIDVGGAGGRLDDWLEANRQTRLQSELSLRFGYDTVRYSAGTGPIAGRSLLLEAVGGWQPTEQQTYGQLRLDGQQFVPIISRLHLMLRVGAGTSGGGRFAQQFFLSSFDTLRGVPFGNSDFLLGEHFWYTTGEFQFPLNAIVRLIFLSDLEGIIGADFGATGDVAEELWDNRVLDFVLGVNIGLGPLVLRMHFAYPIDTGVRLPVAEKGDWVPNFSIGWLYW